jgi:hypothetical protein
LIVRRALQAIHYRRAESLRRNSFRNDKIQVERIQFAQRAKEIRGRFAQVLPLAELSNGGEFQGAAVSSPPRRDLEIALP